MRTTFPWFYKKTEQELKELFDKAVFVFDTNVLLNLYRYSDLTRKDFFQVLEQLSARCFMPHQVAHEYFRNRLSVIYSQKETYDKTIAKVKELKSDIDNSKQHPFVSEKLSLRISEVFDDLFEELDKGKREHSSRLDDDEILEQLSNIFKNVGSEKSSDELVKIAEEGDKRYKEKIPPGFEDASKANEKMPFVERMKAYGDYLIWLEILEHAKEKDVDLIFITDDVKVDWWQKEKGNIIGPRIELVKEFSDKTDKKLFHMYTVERFLEYVSTFVKTDISKESVKEVREFKEGKIPYSFSKIDFLKNDDGFLSSKHTKKNIDGLNSIVISDSVLIDVLNALEARHYTAIANWANSELEDVMSSINSSSYHMLEMLFKIREFSLRLSSLQDNQEIKEVETGYYELGGKILEYFRYKSKSSENY